VGVAGGRGEASPEAEAPGVVGCGIAGEGGGGIELATGVFLAGGCTGAIIGVEAGFANALGFRCHSRNLADDIRSLTMRVLGSGMLSSRASYRCDLDVLGSLSCRLCRVATSGVADLPMADLIAA
jgi:hypothetical protein